MPQENIDFQCFDDKSSAFSKDNKKGRGGKNEDRAIMRTDAQVENPQEFLGQLFGQMQESAKRLFDEEKSKEINQVDDLFSAFKKFYAFLLERDQQMNGKKVPYLEQKLEMEGWNPLENQIDQEQIFKFLNGFAKEFGGPIQQILTKGKKLEEQNLEEIKEQFKAIINVMSGESYDQPGSTACAYVFNPETLEITTANLGDSRVYLVIKHTDKEPNNPVAQLCAKISKSCLGRNPITFKTILLTQDHSLKLPRVRDCVGKKNIGNDGRFCGLNLGGGIGDFDKEVDGKTIIRTPDIATFNVRTLVKDCLGEGYEAENCEFYLINTSDGMRMGTDKNYDFYVDFTADQNNPDHLAWQMLEVKKNKQTLSEYIQNYEDGSRESPLANYLAEQSQSRDDTTVTVFKFTTENSATKSSVTSMIFDGHSRDDKGEEISNMCYKMGKGFLEQNKLPGAEIRSSGANVVNQTAESNSLTPA